MIYYAIRHKPSGGFLPGLRRRRGHTYVEPELMAKAAPRLHETEKGAKSALWYWLNGRMKQYSSWDGEYDIDVDVKPAPERKAEDMEIVRIEVRVR